MSNDLLSRLQAAKTDEEREWVVLEFSLENLEKEIQEALWAAAIPHWFDEKFLAALLQKDVEEVKGTYKRIQELSFVEEFPYRGYNIHERTRKLLLKHLWDDDVEKFRELSHRAVEYCFGHDQEDVGWRVEWIYHLLVTDPNEGAKQMLSAGSEWHDAPNFAYGNTETMIRAAREHADSERLTDNSLAWLQYFEGLLDIVYFRYRLAIEKLLRVEIDSNDKHLMAEVNLRLGEAYQGVDEYESARLHYKNSLSLFRKYGERLGEANCILNLGLISYTLEEYNESRQRFEEALSIYREIDDEFSAAKCISGLGAVHYRLGEYEDAIRRYEETLPIYRKFGSKLDEANSITGLARIHEGLSQNKEARERYLEAKTLYQANGSLQGVANCLLGIADLDVNEKVLQSAEENYRKALTMYQEIGSSFNVALTLWRLGTISESKEDFDQAVVFYQKSLGVFTTIGAPQAKYVQDELDALNTNLNKRPGKSNNVSGK